MNKLKQWWHKSDKTKRLTIVFVVVSLLCVVGASGVYHISNQQDTSDKISDTTTNKKKKEEKQEKEESKEEEKQEGATSEEVNGEESTSEASTSTSNHSSQAATSTGDTSTQNNNNSNESNQPVVTQTYVYVSIIGLDSSTMVQGQVVYSDGDSVYSALTKLCNAYGLSINTTGYGPYVYVSGIGGLLEKQHGSGSGWVFTVNGNRINSGAGTFVLNENDSVVWSYVYS